jgi:hypothetical protein
LCRWLSCLSCSCLCDGSGLITTTWAYWTIIWTRSGWMSKTLSSPFMRMNTLLCGIIKECRAATISCNWLPNSTTYTLIELGFVSSDWPQQPVCVFIQTTWRWTSLVNCWWIWAWAWDNWTSIEWASTIRSAYSLSSCREFLSIILWSCTGKSNESENNQKACNKEIISKTFTFFSITFLYFSFWCISIN